MPDANTNLEVRMAVAERDISNLGVFFKKLDGTLEKVTEIAAALKEIVGNHELKFANQEKENQTAKTSHEDLQKQIDALESTIDKKIEEQTKDINKINYLKYFLMGLIVLVLAKLNVSLPFSL